MAPLLIRSVGLSPRHGPHLPPPASRLSPTGEPHPAPPPGLGIMSGDSYHSIPLEILDDLGARFIINVPEVEQNDLVRICFQIELAHWFYIDEYVEDSNNKYKPKLRTCTIRDFAEHMFRHIGFLKGYADSIDVVLNDWRNYKQSVPTYGAIILNEDISQILIVQGCWSKSSWGFPKGKVNEDEPPKDCAIREVYEETGYDISSKMDENMYLECVINDQTVMLFLIPGVPMSTKFMPRTKNEIRDIQWFPVSDLPNSRKDTVKPNRLNIGPNNLYMVVPFVRSLKKWIGTFKRGHFRRVPSEAHNLSQSNSLVAEPVQNGKNNQQSKKAPRKVQPVTLPPAEDNTPVSNDALAEQKDYDCPSSWSNFRFDRKDIFAAMASTPGWSFIEGPEDRFGGPKTQLSCSDGFNQVGDSVVLVNNAVDLRQFAFDNRASSCCFQGIWILFDLPNYNALNFNAVMYSGWGENMCVNFDGGFNNRASSARVGGAPDGYKYSNSHHTI
eukprot:maker-scaffold383_size189472-snap-gene-0.40 protein:Tk11353 transcript:maker-scaffold383_size189472-snap-gene-0.40-mRNA-1 annotation:"mrna-decapping enzyme 2"